MQIFRLFKKILWKIIRTFISSWILWLFIRKHFILFDQPKLFQHKKASLQILPFERHVTLTWGSNFSGDCVTKWVSCVTRMKGLDVFGVTFAVFASTTKKNELVLLIFLLIKLTSSYSYKMNCSKYFTDSSFSFYTLISMLKHTI